MRIVLEAISISRLTTLDLGVAPSDGKKNRLDGIETVPKFAVTPQEVEDPPN